MNSPQEQSSSIARIISICMKEANEQHAQEVTPVLLMLGMLRDKESMVYHTIRQLGVDVEEVCNKLKANIIPSSQTERTTDPTLSSESTRIIRLASLEARLQHADEIKDVHVLLALLRDRDNAGRNILKMYGVNYERVAKFLYPNNKTHSGFGLVEDEPMPNEQHDGMGRTLSENNANQAKDQQSDTPMLDRFGTDITRAAADGALDPIVGRTSEIERMSQILCRRKKNNPILIGEPGVGKSALAEGLATRIVERKVPHLLTNKRIVALDMASIVAGTQYRGQFEERLRRLIEELKAHKEIILFVDEIHSIIGAGSAPGSLDAANILKPALARGEIQCIGATTISEYRKSIEKDGALERRFQKILIEPTTAEDTLKILHNIKDKYEEHHNVTYTDDALSACVRLSERYISDRALPDKAIDAMDEAGSKAHLCNLNPPKEIELKEQEIAQIREMKMKAAAEHQYETAARLRDNLATLEREVERMNGQWQQSLQENRITVDFDDIASVISQMSGVPAKRMLESETIRLRNMSKVLSSKVIAQDKAISRLSRAITRNRIGLKDPNHPIGTFMFVGPTGVGKTYLVKVLAEFMFGHKDSLIRIDMSEYGEKHSVARLVGAPPGYVGYEEGGQLTERVRRHPYSIILLDEIEKAHQDVFNTLLQVMDEGRLTDGNGTTVDFRNTIIIMTSNSGSKQIREYGSGIGFSAYMGGRSPKMVESIVQKALQKQFAPEFINRLDEIIMFDPLTPEAISKIAEIEVETLKSRLFAVGRELSFTPEALKFIATKGFDAEYGARSLRRTIMQYVEDPLCGLLLSDNPMTRIKADIDTANEKLVFSADVPVAEEMLVRSN